MLAQMSRKECDEYSVLALYSRADDNINLSKTRIDFANEVLCESECLGRIGEEGWRREEIKRQEGLLGLAWMLVGEGGGRDYFEMGRWSGR